MPVAPHARGHRLLRRVYKDRGFYALTVPKDEYYVLTKASTFYPNYKLHPNTGSPLYNLKHDFDDLTSKSHTLLGDIGTNTHAQVDTHIASTSLHVSTTEDTNWTAAYSHITADGSSHSGVALNTTHRGLVTGNPHVVTLAEVGGESPLTFSTGLTRTVNTIMTNDGQINHNSLSNTHNLTTDINHASITGTHNLTTDIDHDALTNVHQDVNTTASPEFVAVTTGEINSAGAINHKPSGDVDDYWQMSTANDVPKLECVGALGQIRNIRTPLAATDVSTKAYADAQISDAAYGAGWDGVTTIAPSKNAVYDEMHKGNYFEYDDEDSATDDIVITDLVVDAAWHELDLDDFKTVPSDAIGFVASVSLSDSSGKILYAWFRHTSQSNDKQISIVGYYDSQADASRWLMDTTFIPLDSNHKFDYLIYSGVEAITINVLWWIRRHD